MIKKDRQQFEEYRKPFKKLKKKNDNNKRLAENYEKKNLMLKQVGTLRSYRNSYDIQSGGM